MAHISSSPLVITKKEEFRTYLEQAGILGTLTKSLAALYSASDKPSDALGFVLNNFFGQNVQDLQERCKKLTSENKGLLEQMDILTKENNTFKEKLAAMEARVAAFEAEKVVNTMPLSQAAPPTTEAVVPVHEDNMEVDAREEETKLSLDEEKASNEAENTDSKDNHAVTEADIETDLTEATDEAENEPEKMEELVESTLPPIIAEAVETIAETEVIEAKGETETMEATTEGEMDVEKKSKPAEEEELTVEDFSTSDEAIPEDFKLKENNCVVEVAEAVTEKEAKKVEEVQLQTSLPASEEQKDEMEVDTSEETQLLSVEQDPTEENTEHADSKEIPASTEVKDAEKEVDHTVPEFNKAEKDDHTVIKVTEAVNEVDHTVIKVTEVEKEDYHTVAEVTKAVNVIESEASKVEDVVEPALVPEMETPLSAVDTEEEAMELDNNEDVAKSLEKDQQPTAEEPCKEVEALVEQSNSKDNHTATGVTEASKTEEVVESTPAPEMASAKPTSAEEDEKEAVEDMEVDTKEEIDAVEQAKQSTEVRQQPLEAGQQPTEVRQQPLEAGQQLTEVGQQPLEVGQQPLEAGQQLTEAGQQPTEAGQQPTEAGQKPTEAGQKPTEVGQETTEKGQQPEDVKQRPEGDEPTLQVKDPVEAVASTGL